MATAAEILLQNMGFTEQEISQLGGPDAVKEIALAVGKAVGKGAPAPGFRAPTVSTERVLGNVVPLAPRIPGTGPFATSTPSPDADSDTDDTTDTIPLPSANIPIATTANPFGLSREQLKVFGTPDDWLKQYSLPTWGIENINTHLAYQGWPMLTEKQIEQASNFLGISYDPASYLPGFDRDESDGILGSYTPLTETVPLIPQADPTPISPANIPLDQGLIGLGDTRMADQISTNERNLADLLDSTDTDSFDISAINIPGAAGQTQEAIPGEGPFTRYLRRRGLGTGGIGLGSQAGRFFANQFPLIENLFKLQSDVRTAGGGLDTDFNIDAFSPRAGTARERANIGSNVLRDYFGLSQDDRRDFNLQMGRSFDEFGGQIEGTASNEYLQNLISAGTQNRFGRRGADFLGKRLPFIRDRFELEGSGGSFAEYFKNRFGL